MSRSNVPAPAPAPYPAQNSAAARSASPIAPPLPPQPPQPQPQSRVPSDDSWALRRPPGMMAPSSGRRGFGNLGNGDLNRGPQASSANQQRSRNQPGARPPEPRLLKARCPEESVPTLGPPPQDSYGVRYGMAHWSSGRSTFSSAPLNHHSAPPSKPEKPTAPPEPASSSDVPKKDSYGVRFGMAHWSSGRSAHSPAPLNHHSAPPSKPEKPIAPPEPASLRDVPKKDDSYGVRFGMAHRSSGRSAHSPAPLNHHSAPPAKSMKPSASFQPASSRDVPKQAPPRFGQRKGMQHASSGRSGYKPTQIDRRSARHSHAP